MTLDSILGVVIPPVADTHEFRQFVTAVYHAANDNYMAAAHGLKCFPYSVSRIVNKEGADSPTIREALGIAYPMALAPYCAEHDTVHCYDCREQVVKPKPRPRKADPTKQTLSTRQDKEIITAAKSAAGMPWSEFVYKLATGEIEVK